MYEFPENIIVYLEGQNLKEKYFILGSLLIIFYVNS